MQHILQHPREKSQITKKSRENSRKFSLFFTFSAGKVKNREKKIEPKWSKWLDEMVAIRDFSLASEIGITFCPVVSYRSSISNIL